MNKKLISFEQFEEEYPEAIDAIRDSTGDKFEKEILWLKNETDIYEMGFGVVVVPRDENDYKMVWTGNSWQSVYRPEIRIAPKGKRLPPVGSEVNPIDPFVDDSNFKN